MIFKMRNMPNSLVSFVIVTHNASKTINKTLDSAKAQFYSPLELIIADDHSRNNTVIECEK